MPSVPLLSASDFRVVAIISTYNEEDVIVPVIQHLIHQERLVYTLSTTGLQITPMSWYKRDWYGDWWDMK